MEIIFMMRIASANWNRFSTKTNSTQIGVLVVVNRFEFKYARKGFG
jgi:hypothetical protein